uniref:Protein kinase domain-containing protein n=1 Tax=Rhabditophanes sp. KR3021 TaxID=114890 RepID=A0AC35TN30_9BILA
MEPTANVRPGAKMSAKALQVQNASMFDRGYGSGDRRTLERRSTYYDKAPQSNAPTYNNKQTEFGVNRLFTTTNHISPPSTYHNTSLPSQDLNYNIMPLRDQSSRFKHADLALASRISLFSDKPEPQSQLMNDSVLLGQYDIHKVLGIGCFGSVKLGTNIITKVNVAIKIVIKSELSEESMTKMRKEIEIMKKIRHPNIVKLFHVIENSSQFSLVMEYCQRGELFNYLGKVTKLTDSHARTIFRQIVSAVRYLHHRNIVHRDLKAENILISEDGMIKVADFGFATHFADGELLDTFCGSPPYAAPELFQGIRYDGVKADCWSLGVCLYSMISVNIILFDHSNYLCQGGYPFYADDLHLLRRKVIECRYVIPLYVSISCVQLLKKIFVVDPLKRANIDVIANSRWLNEGDSVYKPPIPYEHESFDIKRMRVMESYGYSQHEITQSVMDKSHNSIHALYTYLGLSDSVIDVEDEYRKYSSSSNVSSALSNKSFDLTHYFDKVCIICMFIV